MGRQTTHQPWRWLASLPRRRTCDPARARAGAGLLQAGVLEGPQPATALASSAVNEQTKKVPPGYRYVAAALAENSWDFTGPEGVPWVRAARSSGCRPPSGTRGPPIRTLAADRRSQASQRRCRQARMPSLMQLQWYCLKGSHSCQTEHRGGYTSIDDANGPEVQ